MAYGLDVCTGGTASADSELSGEYPASKAFDNDVTSNNLWDSANTAYPHWLKYDLGAGVSKIVAKLRILPHQDENNGERAFVFAGSNNDSSYTDIYSGELAQSETWQDFTFSNSTPYRYYRMTWSTTYVATNYCGIHEVEMMEILTSSAFADYLEV